MSRISLHDKLIGMKILRLRPMLYFVVVTTSVFSVMVLLLSSITSVSQYGIVVILVATAWGLTGFLGIIYTLNKIVERPKDKRIVLRQLSIGLVIMIVLFQALAVLLTFARNLNPLIIAFILLLELIYYVTYTIIGIIPSNRIGIWLATLVSIGLFTEVFLLPFAEYYSGLAVEITGAFIGVFAAITLGEAFKEVENIREGRRLKILVIEELLDVEQQLENGICEQIPIPIWVAALADGSILKLESDFRKAAKEAHKAIHFFNLDAHSQQYRKEALKSISEVYYSF